MKVLIEDEKIFIDGNALEYYPYYFAIWNDIADHRLNVKSVLSQWATALASLRGREGAVYLPYYLDDQTCQYLKAELDGEDVVLTDMLVRDDGYAMDLDDLSREMYSAPEVIESYVDINGHRHDSAPKFFGRYKAKELIEALKDAEVAAA
jgi:hypothetical protein